jgi:hypothetical protein
MKEHDEMNNILNMIALLFLFGVQAVAVTIMVPQVKIKIATVATASHSQILKMNWHSLFKKGCAVRVCFS